MIFNLLFAANVARAVDTSAISRFLDAIRRPDTEAATCALTREALLNYGALLGSGVSDEEISLSLTSPLAPEDIGPFLLERWGACLGLD